MSWAEVEAQTGGAKMARTMDQNYLSRLGFGDPDKKEPRHEAACRFLAQAEVAARLIRYAYGLADAPWEKKIRWENFAVELEGHFVGKTTTSVAAKAVVERPIMKGSGQYATIVGYLDVYIEAATERIHTGEASINGIRYTHRSATTPDSFELAVEVKILETPASEIIRQVKTYQAFFPARFVVVTAYGLSIGEKALLEGERIGWVQLGPDFEAFCAQPREMAPVEKW